MTRWFSLSAVLCCLLLLDGAWALAQEKGITAQPAVPEGVLLLGLLLVLDIGLAVYLTRSARQVTMRAVAANRELHRQIAEIKREIEELRMEAEREERQGNLQRVAEIRYGLLPELEKELASREEPHGPPMVKEEVDEDDIAAVVASWTGIPVSRLLEGEVEKLIHMEDRLHRRVVGQDAAVEAVSNALRRARSGLQDPNRPIGSFVFLGPTGVGKTELARALAEFMFDDERAMVRLDMSEYQERHTVARLVGDYAWVYWAAFALTALLLLTAASVWFMRNQSLFEMWWLFATLMRYPREIFHGKFASPVGWFFSFVVPIMLVSNVPAQIMVRTIEPWVVAYTVFAVVVVLAVSRWFFFLALRRYRSASS